MELSSHKSIANNRGFSMMRGLGFCEEVSCCARPAAGQHPIAAPCPARRRIMRLVHLLMQMESYLRFDQFVSH
jgi:hypothetical protein